MSINGAVFAGLSLGALVLALLAVSLASESPRLASCGQFAGRLLASFDAFGLIGSDVTEGHSPLQQSRPLGGAMSLLSTIAMATLTSALVLSFEFDNVLDQQAIVLLSDARRAQALALPEFRGAQGQGVQVRVTAAGDAGACAAPLAWSATDSGWTFKSTPSCGGSGGASPSQLDFSCASCALSPTSTLDVSLHYSCQTLSVEAAAVSASGDVIAFALPVAETTASAGAHVSSVSWTLEPLLAIVNSSIKDTPSTRGFTLAEIDYAVVKQPLTAEGAGLAVAPNAATVALHIALPLSSFTVILTLAQRMSLLDLVNSLTSLLGIFAFAALLLRAVNTCGRACCSAATSKGGAGKAVLSSAPPADGGSLQAADDDAFSVASPLRASVVSGQPERYFVVREGVDVWYESASTKALVWLLPDGAEAIETGGAVTESAVDSAAMPSTARAAPWICVTEGGDTWFESVETGENSWTLPEGAVLVAKADYSDHTDSFAVTHTLADATAVATLPPEREAADAVAHAAPTPQLIIQEGFSFRIKHLANADA